MPEYKAVEASVKEIDLEARTVTGLAAITGNLDAYMDVVHRGAFRKTIQEGRNRVRHLWQHDAHEPPIATILDLREVGRDDLPDPIRVAYPEADGGLLVTRRYLDTPRGNEVLVGLTSEPPAIREMSFAFDPIKFDFDEDEKTGGRVRHLRELRLYDTSDVNWGANPATVAVKTAVPYKDQGFDEDEGAKWSAPALTDFTDEPFEDLPAKEKQRIAAHFAWTLNNPPQAFSDLKLPHHRAATSGVGPAVWGGVRAAMSALMGGRGGVDIPEGDMKAVHTHLAKEYAHWDKEPPPMEMASLARAASSLLVGADALKAGRVLSERNLTRLRNALNVLNEILLEAEPPQEEDSLKALTDAKRRAALIRKIEFAQRELALA